VRGYVGVSELGRLRQLTQIGVCDLKAALRDGTAPAVLDVRTRSEWEAGHIPGAKHIPLPELPARLGDLDRSASLAVVCGSAYRSSIATSLLAAHGFTRLQNVMGGMTAYEDATCPECQPADLVFAG
jgi:hydroxyacylglutathione hydrolase